MKTIKLLTFTQQSLDHKFLLVSSHLVEDSSELGLQVLRWSKSCWCWRWFCWWRSSLRRFDCLVLWWFGSDNLSWTCIIDVGINGLNLALFRRLVRYCRSFLFLSIIITLQAKVNKLFTNTQQNKPSQVSQVSWLCQRASSETHCWKSLSSLAPSVFHPNFSCV